MRKFLSFAALLALLSGCAQADGVNEKLPVAVDAPETLYAEFDTESGDKEDETRTYVVDEWMLRWHEGDEISFFPVTYNMRYRFNGATGDNGGTFSKLTTDIVTGNELPTRYALYPYQDNTTISDEGRITYHFPDQQIYGEKSFGRGANVMVAQTENHDDNVLRFKNVGGYLKLQIYSSEQRWLDYIELEGNNGERITGEAYIESSYGWDPWVEMSENAGTMLTLDCVDTEHWVDIAISTDPENPTDFWFVLPPTYFDNGITVRIYDTEGNICTKSTYNWIPVERNCIQPLSTFEFVADGGNQGGEDGPSYDDGVIYYDNFDGEEATKTYGSSGTFWPSIDEFPQFANPVGPAAENVTYSGNGITVRSNSTSNSQYSDYAGSGSNNLFFGNDAENAELIIHDIILDTTQKNYKLTFGAHKYLIEGGTFQTNEFHVFISSDYGSNWQELEYSYAGTEEGQWNVATAEISFDVVPETLSIGFLADVAAAYRIDDVCLEASNGGGNEDLELSSWSIIGSMTDWSNDIPMYVYENYHVAYNVSMIAGDEFKFRKDSAWEFNYGGDFIGFGERTSAIGDGGNIQIPEDGIYDIYFDSNALVFYIMYAGEVPSDGNTPISDIFEGTIPNNQIWYTTENNQCVELNNLNDYGNTTFISNTYENGVGVITFDNDITLIAIEAFADSNVTKVRLPETVTSIGHSAFHGCGHLSKINLPDAITFIDGYAFAWCGNLKEIDLPENLENIEYWAFVGCDLSTVRIPDKVESINASFGGNPNLEKFEGKFASEDSKCLIINGVLSGFAPANMTQYKISSEVYRIASWCFSCYMLEYVTIPSSVTQIDDRAFNGCEKLFAVEVLSDNLEYCGGTAFDGCIFLQQFWGPLASDDNRCLIIDNTIVAFARYGVKTYTIPEYITSIGADVFRGCEELTAINIHDNVSYIGGGAFEGCNGLRSITIPDKVTVIEPYTFYCCRNLYDVKLGKYTTTIRSMAFADCESLRMLYLPSTIESIEGHSLLCPSMTELYCAAPTPPYLEGDTIYGDDPGRTIYVPVDSVTAYQTANVWSDFADEFVGYDFENNEIPTPPTIPINPEDCEWADVYLSLPTEEDAVNNFYPFNCIFVNVTGTDLISGRYTLLDITHEGTEYTIEEALEYSSPFDSSWIDSINSSGSIRLRVGANPSITVRVIMELTNANGDIVRFDRVITTTEAPHPDMEKWVGTWSLSADQVVNWIYVDGVYNGPTLIDQSATYDITIEAATDIAYNKVRVYGLTPLTTSNGEPISVLAYIHDDGYLILESATVTIEQINESEVTYWFPYIKTSNGVEVLPYYGSVFVLSLSEDGLTATNALYGTIEIEYNGEVCDLIGMDVFAFDVNTGAVRTLYNPETMPEVNSPAGNITLTRTSSAAKAAYAPTKRASVANGTFKIEMVK